MKVLYVKILVSYLLLSSSLTPSSWADSIRDVKPPVDFPPNYWFLLVLLVALSAAFIPYLLRFLKSYMKKSKAVAPPPKPPHTVAFERLDDLVKENWPAQGKIKEYYFALSAIVRHYIEDRFAIRAPEMTTEEFFWSLRNYEDLTEIHKGLLKDFLHFCDLVKFAKYAPNPKDIEEGLRLARKFIAETKETSAEQPVNKT